MKLKIELQWKLKGSWGATIVMVAVLQNTGLPSWAGLA